MCVVSMVTDHYQEKWGWPGTLPNYINPGMIPPVEVVPLPFITPVYSPDFVPKVEITKEQWEEYQELKRKAAEYDARTDQPHCEKPGVDEFEKAVVNVLIKRGLILVNGA